MQQKGKSVVGDSRSLRTLLKAIPKIGRHHTDKQFCSLTSAKLKEVGGKPIFFLEHDEFAEFVKTFILLMHDLIMYWEKMIPPHAAMPKASEMLCGMFVNVFDPKRSKNEWLSALYSLQHELDISLFGRGRSAAYHSLVQMAFSHERGGDSPTLSAPETEIASGLAPTLSPRPHG